VNADGGTSGQHIQVMDINQGLQNTVSIGTTDNPADLKVYGDLLASSTAYSEDILPGQRGVQDLGNDDLLKEWGNVWLAEDGKISFGSQDVETGLRTDGDVELEHVQQSATVEGLLLNGINKIFFEDFTNLDQFIGSETAGSGITAVKSPSGVLLESAGSRVNVTGTAVDLTSSGSVAFTAGPLLL